MRRSKYAALALLISTVGPSALQAAENGIVSHAAPASHDLTRRVFKKLSRAEDRHARLVAQRMKELIEHLKNA